MKIKEHDYTYRGAYGLFKKDGIPNSRQTASGSIEVDVNVIEKEDYTVVYARVSSSENKDNLDNQAERVSQFCSANGWVIKDVVKECASGLNDKRPKLKNILQNKNVTRIVVEHKDRLTRFGYEYIKTLFDGQIVIINETVEEKSDLIQDFVSLVTSFCARLYGQRRSRRKTEQLIRELERKND